MLEHLIPKSRENYSTHLTLTLSTDRSQQHCTAGVCLHLSTHRDLQECIHFSQGTKFLKPPSEWETETHHYGHVWPLFCECQQLPKWDGIPVIWAFNYHPCSSTGSNCKNLGGKRSNVNGLNFERLLDTFTHLQAITSTTPTPGSAQLTWYLSNCRCLVFTSILKDKSLETKKVIYPSQCSPLCESGQGSTRLHTLIRNGKGAPDALEFPLLLLTLLSPPFQNSESKSNLNV